MQDLMIIVMTSALSIIFFFEIYTKTKWYYSKEEYDINWYGYVYARRI